MAPLIRIVNDEDRRSVEWLITNVGEARVTAAAQRLSRGGRGPFVSAVCRYLGAWPPPSRASAAENSRYRVGDEYLARIRELLARRHGPTAPAH
ncbi:hypothetical protein [Paraburkholderia acidisoli]|uniref:Uncharacterized protein n=1 Tax=Paraburkholderia acidisoli TaxID=2571748 RepID=A0A7Z2GQ09_9BURK|nr:hypothetical protein [Paraburkholderia acidisoli]QGZ65549.1 hypothetical protein FAZ98_27790 [Paraburkholderia acidisoli]